MLNTPKELETLTSEILDHDGEPVNPSGELFALITQLADHYGFTDVTLTLADYAYVRAALTPTEEPEERESWRESALALSGAAE